MSMDFHPIAGLFPLIEGDEFAALTVDIVMNGLHEPIWTYEGNILDGRNRYRACEVAGVAPRYQGYEGDDPLSFVLSLNLRRRHLTASQRTMLALDLLPQFEQEAAARMKAGKKNDPGKKVSQGRAAEVAADLTHTNQQYVKKAKKAIEMAPDLEEHMRSGILSVPDAAYLAKSPVEMREKVIARVIGGERLKEQLAKEAEEKKALAEKYQREAEERRAREAARPKPTEEEMAAQKAAREAEWAKRNEEMRAKHKQWLQEHAGHNVPATVLVLTNAMVTADDVKVVVEEWRLMPHVERVRAVDEYQKEHMVRYGDKRTMDDLLRVAREHLETYSAALEEIDRIWRAEPTRDSDEEGGAAS